jgi:large subunit ribosomal protein L14e
MHERTAEREGKVIKMMDVGRVCVKIAGRDAGLKCVIVSILDDTFVMVDGETRARKCNLKHLEPTAIVLEIESGASHEKVLQAFKKAGIAPKEWKKAENKTAKSAKPKKIRGSAAAPEKAKEPSKPKAAKPAKK